MAKVKLLAIADTPSAHEQGLQFVRDMPEMSGMLFKFQSPRVLSFWARNTYIPLDIAFIDSGDVIVKTESMAPFSTRSVTSGRPCLMALEVPRGTLDKAGYAVGSRILVDWEKRTIDVHDAD